MIYMATRARTLLLFVAAFTVGLVLVASHKGSQDEHNTRNSGSLTFDQNITLHRKHFHDGDQAKTKRITIRANKQEKCSKNDISVAQGPTEPQPDGIPTYTVQITNTCETGCAIANIHFSCGSFSSAIPIDPIIFRRIAIDDCLVNDGQPLASGLALSFDYATTFQFPLSVSSITC